MWVHHTEAGGGRGCGLTGCAGLSRYHDRICDVVSLLSAAPLQAEDRSGDNVEDENGSAACFSESLSVFR